MLLLYVDPMMEAVLISETSAYFNESSPRYIPEGYHQLRHVVFNWDSNLKPSEYEA
jgi:hypothetical protein